MHNIQTIIAVSIETSVWNKAIDSLLSEGWVVTYKYDNMDAGIDFDLLVLKKEDEEVLFGWDNWVEGEIKCSAERMRYIEGKIGSQFKIGEPVNLKPGIIGMYWKG